MGMNRDQTQIPLITTLVLSFSVLSVILCKSEILAYGFQLQPFIFSIDKNYVFLLCNGLLVFIATTSGLIGSSSSVKTDSKSEERTGFNRIEKFESSKTEFVQEAEETKMESLFVQNEGEEKGNDQILEEEEEGFGSMSNEELNKKCEEFIRKMREEIYNLNST